VADVKVVAVSIGNNKLSLAVLLPLPSNNDTNGNRELIFYPPVAVSGSGTTISIAADRNVEGNVIALMLNYDLPSLISGRK
jgi:hypothetical protein